MIRLRSRLVWWLLAGALALPGAWQLRHGLWIHAKAVLAQHLLNSAWQHTLAQRAASRQPRVLPWPWADTWPVARLQVPRLDVDLVVLAGDNGRTLAFGPGHRFGTAAPGASGLSVISAHRDTHFAFLRRVRSDDLLRLVTWRGEQRQYRVVDTAVIEARRDLALRADDGATLALVTCYPFDTTTPGSPLRYVVTAREVAAVPGRQPERM